MLGARHPHAGAAHTRDLLGVAAHRRGERAGGDGGRAAVLVGQRHVGPSLRASDRISHQIPATTSTTPSAAAPARNGTRFATSAIRDR
ncbi:hypothetical protein [Saccharopolyspora karakumensis]|uniref:hypothetical protein n=1 Tax=Saccharopolyspora karakumensis TaxID=2530386 RepID=UPI0014048F1A|nr:hypothetical protein [Saccharopolyspora karakumensis]